MNLALDRYADNPVIDEPVAWPPRQHANRRVCACSLLLRKPFIEVDLIDGTQFRRHFARDSLVELRAAAAVIPEALSDIEGVSEFRYAPLQDADACARKVLACRDECLAEAKPMCREGMYAPYLMRFGLDYARLPGRVQQMRAEARRHLHAPD